MQIGESVILVRGLYHNAKMMDQWLGKTVKVAAEHKTDPDFFVTDDPTMVYTLYDGSTKPYIWEYVPCKAEYNRQMAAKGNMGTTVTGRITWVEPAVRENYRGSDEPPVTPCAHDLIPSACDHGRPWCRKCGYKPEEVRP